MKNNWQTKQFGEQVSFDIIVHAWLQNEWYKPQYNAKRAKIPASLITEPDFQSHDQNILRLELLKFTRRPMIDPIPGNTVWYKIQIDKTDLERIFHIPSADWWDISNNTYHVSETIKNIDSNKNHAGQIREIITTLGEREINDDLILVASNPASKFTVIEGNHRFSAMVYKTVIEDSRPIVAKNAMIGISPDMKNYAFHIEKYI